MSLRFTDTQKWEDGWYQELDPDFKHAWDYVNDVCDNAGVWEVTPLKLKLANQKVGGRRDGFAIDWEAFRAEAKHRILVLENGAWWSTRHIVFQCRGILSTNPKNQPHRFIIRLLRGHGL